MKHRRRFKGPVKWLLGSRLVSGLKWVLMYSLSGTKSDPRNWMTAKEDETFKSGRKAFWFDYMADSGDAQAATYSLACMCLSSMWLDTEDGIVKLNEADRTKKASAYEELPRGEFLFIGGDTAYHIADYATLVRRLQLPFDWAFEDTKEQLGEMPDVKPLYGIPGNHDYYDFLDGFNRQFRRPYDDKLDGKRGTGAKMSHGSPQLQLAGFKRAQEASYVALDLPHGWKLWGLDSQGGVIDRRQEHFFSQLTADRRLILATPEPSTFFGRRAREDDALTKTLQSLGLAVPFLDGEKLDKDHCRLDLSGNIHHYARYWGPVGDEESNYASVVTGGGGAFLHPTDTDFRQVDCARQTPCRDGDTAARECYPEKTRSRRETITRLLKPWSIFRGGNAWSTGGVFAAFLTWAITALASLRPVAARLVELVGASLAQPASAWPIGEASNEPFTRVGTAPIVLVLLASFVLFGHKQLKKLKKADITEVDNGVVCALRNHALLALVTFSGLAFLLLRLWSRAPTLHPFWASVHITAAGLLGVATLVWNARYRETLYQQARFRTKGVSGWDHLPSVLLFLLPWVWFFAAALTFGGAPAVGVVFDATTFLALMAVGLGLPVLGFVVGGYLHGIGGKIGFGLFGLWHASMYIVVPALMSIAFPWQWILATLSTIAVLNFLAVRLIRWHTEKLARGFVLLPMWILVGLVPLIVAAVFVNYLGCPAESFVVGWGRLVLALLLGAFLTCIHFGWYLAVSLCFNGHNNEAGAAAALPKYRHLVRVRLTARRVTVYVIGIDEAATERGKIEAKLVDRFTLSCAF